MFRRNGTEDRDLVNFDTVFCLTIGAQWSVSTYSFVWELFLTSGAFFLTIEFFGYNGKVHLISTLTDCKQEAQL